MNIVFLDEYSLGGIDLSRIKQLGNLVISQNFTS